MKSIKPFNLRVDWLLWEHYGEPVVVELLVMDEKDVVIHESADPPAAVGWARKWLEDRGFGFLCDVDFHQRMDHTHITLHAVPIPYEPKDL